MWRPQALAERGLGAMGMAWISVTWITFPVWAFGGRERRRCRFGDHSSKYFHTWNTYSLSILKT